VVTSFAQVFSARSIQPDDLALARRVLTHEQADVIVAGLLSGHLGDRLDPVEAAQAARRARAPTAVESPAPAPADQEPPRRSRRRSRRDRLESSAPEPPSPAEEPMGPVPESPPQASEPERGNAATSTDQAAAPVEVYVSVGRRDNVGPDELYAALERLGLERSLVAYVKVRHRHTFLGVAPEAAERAIQVLTGASIGGKQVTAEPARRGGDSPSDRTSN
jgi:hypothetical protein